MKQLGLLAIGLMLGIAPAHAANQTIVLAGGCFWGVEAVFEHTKGVISAKSGYAGGDAKSADYDQVSNGTTRHAEVVEVVYDPALIQLDKLLDIYFTVAHNPTQLNYQGPDHGTQYRSAVFYASPEQKAQVEAKIAALKESKLYSRPIVTTLEPLDKFYEAEKYHQDFAAKNPNHPYIRAHDAPKVADLQRKFPDVFVR